MTASVDERPRWHLLRARATTGHTFAISPPAWKERRLTLESAHAAYDRERGVYERAATKWRAWLRASLISGRIATADVEAVYARVVPIALEDDSGDMEDLWVLAQAAVSMRERFPTLMAEFATERLTARQQETLREAWELRDFAARFEEGPGGWNARRPALWRGDWPEDVAVVQVQDGPRWGPLTNKGSFFGFHPPLADERFVAVLEAAGETAGWHPGAIDVRGRDWTPVTTHRAVFVDERIRAGGIRDSAAALGGPFWTYAYVRPENEAMSASILHGDHGLYLSPSASAALARAKLKGIELAPLRYEDEVPVSERRRPGDL